MPKRVPMPRWSPAEDARLRALYGTMPVRDVAELLGRSKMAVQTRASDMKLDGRPVRWSQAEKAKLAALYPCTPMAELCAAMNRPKDQVRYMAKKLQLTRPPAIRLAGVQRLPLGTERRNARGDLMRKVKEHGPRSEAWKRVEVILWEEAHGPVPAGMVVTRQDPKRPVSQDNLILASRADMVQRQRPDLLYTPEVHQLIRLKSAITREVIGMEAKAESEKSEAT